MSARCATRNEDTVAVDDWVMSQSMDQPMTMQRLVEAPMVCLVADGLGGHAGGDVASRFVAECLAERAAEATDAASLKDLLRRGRSGAVRDHARAAGICTAWAARSRACT